MYKGTKIILLMGINTQKKGNKKDKQKICIVIVLSFSTTKNSPYPPLPPHNRCGALTVSQMGEPVAKKKLKMLPKSAEKKSTAEAGGKAAKH